MDYRTGITFKLVQDMGFDATVIGEYQLPDMGRTEEMADLTVHKNLLETVVLVRLPHNYRHLEFLPSS